MHLRSDSSARASTPPSAPHCTKARPRRRGSSTATGCSTSSGWTPSVGELLERARAQRATAASTSRTRASRTSSSTSTSCRPRRRRWKRSTRSCSDDGRAIGHNTDASGFAESFRRGLRDAPLGQGRRARRRRRGRGGRARRAASSACASSSIVDVDAERAAALAERLGAVAGDLDELADADGLIHATPTGMAAHPGLPLPGGAAAARAVGRRGRLPPARDRAAAARARARLPDARRRRDGRACRPPGAFELFTGVTPDRERMLRHFADARGAGRSVR